MEMVKNKLALDWRLIANEYSGKLKQMKFFNEQ